MGKIKATVFIPTYNGGKYIAEIIDNVVSQKVDFDFELLIIDSGSKDNTLKVINDAQARYKNIRLHEIANSEYGHGKTRNLAAKMAEGEIVVYLSHDATPSHSRWLYEMVRPFEINPKIVGVMGKQIPRAHCIPMLKSEINSVFSGFGSDFGTSLFYKDDFINDQGVYDAVSFYSDANSAARKSFLTNEISYQDVNYAEDQLFGRDIVNKGYYKAYAPRGSVFHSNDLKLSEYKHRMFDETLGLRKIGLKVNIPSKPLIARMITRGVLRDIRNILKDPQYSGKRKLYWLALNPLYHIEKWRGVRLGSITELDNSKVSDKYSLEKQRTKVVK